MDSLLHTSCRFSHHWQSLDNFLAVRLVQRLAFMSYMLMQRQPSKLNTVVHDFVLKEVVMIFY